MKSNRSPRASLRTAKSFCVCIGCRSTWFSPCIVTFLKVRKPFRIFISYYGKEDISSVAMGLACTTMIFLLERKGRFTPWTMTSGRGRWLFFMVRLPWSNLDGLISLKKSIYKVFGSLTRCKPQVDQEEWPCTKKWMCWFCFNICPNRTYSKKIEKLQVWPFFLSSLVFIFSSYPPPNKYIIITIFPCHGSLPFFDHSTSIAYSHRKTLWTMSVDNVGLKICLLETLNSMVTLTLFPWCKPRWSRDKFNTQSQILQGLRRTSWSML